MTLLCSQLFKLMDIDGNGYISREEFIKAFEPKFDLPKHPSAGMNVPWPLLTSLLLAHPSVAS